jgi:hypothetical protein
MKRLYSVHITWAKHSVAEWSHTCDRLGEGAAKSLQPRTIRLVTSQQASAEQGHELLGVNAANSTGGPPSILAHDHNGRYWGQGAKKGGGALR